ncbi:MAG: polysaccharide deacetylase family protein [Planctomycetota bacterium]
MIGVLLALLAASGTARGGEPVQRQVVALFDSMGREDDLDTEDPVHQLLEMPLNYLGMVVRRHDIRKGPPPEAWLANARALVTYFEQPNACPDWLWSLLEETRVRVVHFGHFGCLEADKERLARWLKRFGLIYDDSDFTSPLEVRVELRGKELCALESDPRKHAIHMGPHNVDARNRVWVRTRAVMGRDDDRTPVVTGEWGAVALEPYTVIGGGEHNERRWHLDPFPFFREALGLVGVPAPHPQVLNGRRMFFMHVDGDGFESTSTVADESLAARVFCDEIIERYRLPMTVSIVVRSLTDDYSVAKPTARMKLAREIFHFDHVEPASHGVLHPLRWDKRVLWYPTIKNFTYSPVREVADSIRFINGRLAPPGRSCRLMLWTGEANPSSQAIATARESGCLNLNGGVFRWDARTDSVGFVSPWGHARGSEVQVYVGAANENDYEGFFTTMPSAFTHASVTIERSGSPRILKPANVYCHFYSAERPARLKALKGLIERWGIEEETAPVFASDYAGAVHSALTTARIEKIGSGWAFRDFGDCRTVRIDGEQRKVDWSASRGLIGARRMGGALFLHLGTTDAEVVLSDSATPRPHVEQADHPLKEVSLSPQGITLVSGAHSSREIVLAGFPPGARLRSGETVDAEGRIRIRMPDPGIDRLELTLP